VLFEPSLKPVTFAKRAARPVVLFRAMERHTETPGSSPGRTAQLLNKSETRALLGGISLPTLNRLRQRGELPAVRIGRRAFFRVDDVEAFIARHRET
jgi:excisionase family DNA binding protein